MIRYPIGRLPYDLNAPLPSQKTSPAVNASAPYTPAVMSLIAQLEPSNPPTQAQLANADALLHDGPSPSCQWLAAKTPSLVASREMSPMCRSRGIPEPFGDAGTAKVRCRHAISATAGTDRG